MSSAIRIIQCGIGPIGQGVTREAAGRDGVTVVGAVDLNPDLSGRDLGEVAGLGRLGVVIAADAARAVAAAPADVAVVTTTSSLLTVESQLAPFLDAGLPVVSSCEELADPFDTAPEVAARLDSRARERGVAVLGTGVNPGFLMDLLPLVASAPVSRVDHVCAERIQDAGLRRLPFQLKVGAGLDLDEFTRRVESKQLRHVGLTESMHMIARALGWRLSRTEDVVRALVAEAPVASDEISVSPGGCRGVEQVGRAFIGDREVIELVFRATIGEPEPIDRVTLRGEPTLKLEIRGGVPGDTATCSILVNSIPNVLSAAPGLRTMRDVAPVTWWKRP